MTCTPAPPATPALFPGALSFWSAEPLFVLMPLLLSVSLSMCPLICSIPSPGPSLPTVNLYQVFAWCNILGTSWHGPVMAPPHHIIFHKQDSWKPSLVTRCAVLEGQRPLLLGGDVETRGSQSWHLPGRWAVEAVHPDLDSIAFLFSWEQKKKNSLSHSPQCQEEGLGIDKAVLEKMRLSKRQERPSPIR